MERDLAESMPRWSHGTWADVLLLSRALQESMVSFSSDTVKLEQISPLPPKYLNANVQLKIRYLFISSQLTVGH